MCRSSPLTGLHGPVGPVGRDFLSSAWCSRRVLPPLSVGDDSVCCLWLSFDIMCLRIAFRVGVLSLSSMLVAGSLRGMAYVGLLGYVRLLGLYFHVLLYRVCFVLSPYFLIFTEFCAFLWVGSAAKVGVLAYMQASIR